MEPITASKNLKALSNAKFLRWFLFLNGALILSIIWTGPGMLLIPLLGFGGALFSLIFAKWLAKRAHGVEIIDPQNFASKEGQKLYELVSNLAENAGLATTPEVGIYESEDMNAFATGATQRGALVAFSTGLLESMDESQIRAVAAHEIAHIANRDMLGMVLLQGVINSIVLAVTLPLNLIRIVNFFTEKDGWVTSLIEGTIWLVKAIVALILTFLGSLVLKAFSRQREYRADAFAAVLLGKDPMISALNVLATDKAEIPVQQRAYSSFKVSGRESFLEFFSTHPAIEKRIAALEEGRHLPR